MMQIAIMSYSYASRLQTGHMDTAAAIRAAHDLGVAAVELMDHLIGAAEPPLIERTLAETGCRVIAYDLMVDFLSPDPANRGAAVAQAQRGLARAAALGARTVLLFAGRLKPEMSPVLARRWLSDGLRASLDEAHRLGLTLTIENLGIEPTLCGTAEHLLELCAAVGPGLRLTYDAGNFLLAGSESLAALTALAPSIVHVHLKDWLVTPVDAPLPAGGYRGVDGRGYCGAALGEGVVDLVGVLAVLRRLHYDGYLAIEYEGLAEPEAAVSRGLAFVRAQLGAPPDASV